jgi:hypothetical protein
MWSFRAIIIKSTIIQLGCHPHHLITMWFMCFSHSVNGGRRKGLHVSGGRHIQLQKKSPMQGCMTHFQIQRKNSWHAFHLGWSTTQRNFLIYLRTLICEKCEPPGKEGDYTYSLRVFIGVRFLPLLRSRWMNPPSHASWYTNIKVHDNLHHVLYNMGGGHSQNAGLELGYRLILGPLK